MDLLYTNDIDILLIQEVMVYCLDNIPGYVCCSDGITLTDIEQHPT